MFQEEFEEERFSVNRGRDEFIDQLLAVCPISVLDEKKEKNRPSDYL